MGTGKGARTAAEVVGLFRDRTSFEAAVEALLQAGFERADLSVLASHESLDAAGKPGKPWRDVLTALVGDLKYEGPLVASGLIFLAAGPVTATLAAVAGAAVGGMAAKEFLEEVTAQPHTDDFARSLEAGGVILWVCAESEDRRALAATILSDHGGQNVHLSERTPEG
ncbi:MAG: hypothetical protein U0S49_15395 [Rhodospirillales bacterium]|jgi:hypothetical protein|nr:hypothetical protein [Rhodospirillales bacterium]